MEFVYRLFEKITDVVFAGFIGSLVASWWHRDDLTNYKAWIIFLVTGVACAFYLTGMVSSHLSITEPSNVAGVGFLLGAFGGSLMTAINRAIKAADLWALIRSKFGGGS
jgi:protein-S-isoprenylcysteine O-methyltransferase Ste14